MPRAQVNQPDPKSPDSQVRILDFPGMSPGLDQHTAPLGSSWFQVNAVSLYPGELRARRGYQVVRFDQPPRLFTYEVAAESVYVLGSEATADVVPRGDYEVVAASFYRLDAAAISFGTGGLVTVEASSAYGLAVAAVAPALFDVDAASSYVLTPLATSYLGGADTLVAAATTYVCTAAAKVPPAVLAEPAYRLTVAATSYLSGSTSFSLLEML